MKFYSNNTSALYSAIKSEEISAVLICGQDSGAVRNLYEQLAKLIVSDLNDPFSVAHIDNDQIKEDTSCIYDEMTAISFGMAKKLVTIKNFDNNKDSSSRLIEQVSNLPLDITTSAFCLITAGELSSKEKLVQYFEKEKNLAVVHCYKLEDNQISANIALTARQKGLQIQADAIQLLTNYCKGDTKIIESELEKIYLYKYPETEVTLSDIIQTTGNYTENTVQELIDATFSGNKSLLDILYYRILKQDSNALIMIIRSFQRYIERLHIVYNLIKRDNMSLDMAISKLAPPIFFKQKPVFQSHMQRRILHLDELYFRKCYEALYNAEISAKSSHTMPDIDLLSAIKRF